MNTAKAQARFTDATPVLLPEGVPNKPGEFSE